MTGLPRVTIVTPSFNQGRFLERCLRSVLCQHYPDLEYLVLDGGSTDESREILERHAPLLSGLVIGPDGGQAEALDRGFRQATGEVFAWLNADDCLAGPTVVTRAVRALQRLPDRSLVYGRRIMIDAEGCFLHRCPPAPYCPDALKEVDFIPQECAFWTRAAHEHAGNRIDRSFSFALDYELWLRMQEAGISFAEVPFVAGYFRSHPDQKTQARWQTVGLSEIGRLQDRYLGRRLSDKELTARYHRHIFGRGLAGEINRRLALRLSWLWSVWHTRLVRRPLDAWSLGCPLPPGRGTGRLARSA